MYLVAWLFSMLGSLGPPPWSTGPGEGEGEGGEQRVGYKQGGANSASRPPLSASFDPATVVT